VESPTPVTKGRRGGSGVDARGGCGGTRRRAVSEAGARVRRGGAGEHHGGTGECYGGDDGRRSGDDGRRNGACRTVEEQETGLLLSKVSHTFPT
jgi:hypothetical protein